MSALRDIINHYIRESAVTFEMVEMSLKIEKLGSLNLLIMDATN